MFNLAYELYKSDVSSDIIIAINSGFIEGEPSFSLMQDVLSVHSGSDTFHLRELPSYATKAIQEDRVVLAAFGSFGLRHAYGVSV